MNKPARIIPRTPRAKHASQWQQSLSGAVDSPAELDRRLGLAPRPAAGAAGEFRVRVPEAFLGRIRAGDPDDPLLRQVFPDPREDAAQPGYSTDPLAEQQAMAVPGLLQKYPGRALLTLTGACAIHCRYCFRRHFPYAEASPRGARWQAVLDYLRAHPDVEEIILSGGDPLTLADDRLAACVADLETVPHLQRLRLHTRTPVVLPERVTPALLDWLGGTRFQTLVVVHVNHANELDTPAGTALQALRGSGALLLNQAVLLAGVNDSVEALEQLGRALIAAGVLPYYLHQLDPVQGAAHFAVSDARAQALITRLQAQASGYLIPRLVREIPGAPGKTPL